MNEYLLFWLILIFIFPKVIISKTGKFHLTIKGLLYWILERFWRDEE